MALHDLPGSTPKARMKANKSNLEQAENEANAEKKQLGGFDKFPMHVHKPGGLVREVTNEDDLADALAKGWYDDLHTMPQPESSEVPTQVNHMTLAQAKKLIAKADTAELVAIEQDEISHGSRADVLALIAAAKDNIGGGKPAPKAKAKAKAAKTPKKK